LKIPCSQQVSSLQRKLRKHPFTDDYAKAPAANSWSDDSGS
jgi:hypothetical protein